MSLYVVIDTENPEAKKRLVKAASSNIAVRHVVGSRFDATLVRKAEDAADLMSSGMTLEIAGEDGATVQAPEPVKEDAPTKK